MKQLFTKHKTTVILVAILAAIYFIQTRLVYAADDVILYETDDNSDGKMLETGQKLQAKKGDYIGFIFSTKPTKTSPAWRVKRKGIYFLLNPENPAYKRGLF